MELLICALCGNVGFKKQDGKVEWVDRDEVAPSYECCSDIHYDVCDECDND